MKRVKFKNELFTARVETNGARPKSRLLKDLKVIVDNDEIIIPEGYISDWASTPRIIWWLYPPTYAPSQRGAWLHDRIYTDLFDIYSKDFADRALQGAIIEDGGSEFSAKMFYWATSWFGKGGWNN